MMKEIILTISCVLFLLNCRKSDEIPNDATEYKIAEYNPKYMDYRNSAGSLILINGENIKINYQNSMISKRVGEVIYTPSYYMTTPDIYDDITHSTNEINITKKTSSPNLIIPSYIKKISLYNGKISQIFIQSN